MAQRSGAGASLFAVNAYWGGLSYMWNSLHPIVLPAMLAALVPAERKNTYLGLLTFTGLVIAMVLQPVAGAVSDHWVSRFGRRRPLMLIGTAFSVLFLSILGWAGGLTWIFVGYVGLQISSNTAQGPLQGLLRDRVKPQQLGAASAIKVFLDLSSLVAASAISGRLVSTGAGGQPATFMVMIALLIGAASVTILFTAEESSGIQGGQNAAPASMEGNPNSREESGYRWLIAERAAFLLGVYGLQAFGQYYLQDALHVPDPARASGNLLSIIGAGTILFVIAAGWLSDRVGPRRLLFAASGLACAGMLGMLAATHLVGLYGAGSLIGAGMGLFLTSNWALANRMAPAQQAGHHLGLTNIATAGAAALARLEGPAVDWLNAAQPGAWIGYQSIFVFGAACIVLSTWFLAKLSD
jgi:MFS family permease